MPPSSKKIRSAKKSAVEAIEQSDIETPESIATPSKPTRKRGRTNEGVPGSAVRPATRRKIKDTRAVEREDTEGTEGGDPSDADTDAATPTEVEVISKLRCADRLVYATQDFANDLLEGRDNVPGYGKIAGRDWTYIIKELEVNIGRPEQHEKLEQQQEIEKDQNAVTSPSAKQKISIDLGPDRQTSRLHATITYDGATGQWFIIVNGRNGLRLDTHLLKRGQKTYLRSGSVIDICGTQMAFITTPTAENEGPVFADAIIRQVYTSDETDGDGDGPKSSGLPTNDDSEGLNDPNQSQAALLDGQQSTQKTQTSSNGAGNSKTAQFATPGTPVRQQATYQSQYSKPSPGSAGGYSRGVMMESTESIDYSADSAKDLKPPHSYAQLIGMAILSVGEQQMTLNNIYKWITTNFAFYRFNTGGWQNSIRHNLSLNKAFEKIARRTDEPGKGMKWMISPKERDSFLSQGMKGCRRLNGNGTVHEGSDPSSPVRFGGQIIPPSSVASKADDNKSPPALNYYARPFPAANEAFTPDRGPRRSLGGPDDNEPELVYYPPSAKSTLNHLTAAAQAAGSPPPLYVADETRIGMLDTPFPTIRSSQKLMPPGTLQRPSSFMEFSSPAPFWKFGSTPLKPLTEISPMKTPFSNLQAITSINSNNNNDHDMKIDNKIGSGLREGDSSQPSSPPQINGGVEPGNGSPVKPSSRPGSSRRVPLNGSAHDSLTDGGDVFMADSAQSKTPLTMVNTSLMNGAHQHEQAQALQAQTNHIMSMTKQHSANTSQSQSNNLTMHAPVLAPAPVLLPTPNLMPRFDQDDDGGIDLMK